MFLGVGVGAAGAGGLYMTSGAKCLEQTGPRFVPWRVDRVCKWEGGLSAAIP